MQHAPFVEPHDNNAAHLDLFAAGYMIAEMRHFEGEPSGTERIGEHPSMSTNIGGHETIMVQP